MPSAIITGAVSHQMGRLPDEFVAWAVCDLASEKRS
jgi:hypothetical protein